MAAPQNTIVVGVDGSPSSRSALSWALGQASLTGASVTAVIAWEFPAFYSWEGGTMPPEEFEDAAHENLHRAVDETVTDEHRHITVHREVRHGHAAQVMLEACKGAELLVLGSRGHGGFVGALLGSVSHKCVHHAGCPVVILRG
ncbi:universal stress protein [Allosaccharopolyspora coralli]|uniref:Universal stress protein n=1 Tax=Allosaccharopolyspora coralli TaxID=2665642 RepID=A0A5Q3QEZ3_9PSEU|nr:universal stress protein [Allosaccharopolyspora coralli]QGK70085.1 universal stress protein [Allosaccharopolyspora coralli]